MLLKQYYLIENNVARLQNKIYKEKNVKNIGPFRLCDPTPYRDYLLTFLLDSTETRLFLLSIYSKQQKRIKD